MSTIAVLSEGETIAQYRMIALSFCLYLPACNLLAFSVFTGIYSTFARIHRTIVNLH